MILTDEQKEKRKIKIQVNRETKIIEDLNKITDISDDFGKCFDLVEYRSKISNQSLSETESQSSSSDSNEICDTVYREAVQLEFSVFPFERPLSNYNTFNELEVSRLKELLSAMTALQTPCPQNLNIRLIENVSEAIKLLCIKCDHEIRNIVKMSKKLKGFRNINEVDQLILVKHSAIRIIGLRLAQFFDLNGQHWNVIIVIHITLKYLF